MLSVAQIEAMTVPEMRERARNARACGPSGVFDKKKTKWSGDKVSLGPPTHQWVQGYSVWPPHAVSAGDIACALGYVSSRGLRGLCDQSIHPQKFLSKDLSVGHKYEWEQVEVLSFWKLYDKLDKEWGAVSVTVDGQLWIFWEPLASTRHRVSWDLRAVLKARICLSTMNLSKHHNLHFQSLFAIRTTFIRLLSYLRQLETRNILHFLLN